MNPMSLLLALVFTLTLAAPLSVGIDNKLRFEVVPAETAASPVERVGGSNLIHVLYLNKGNTRRIYYYVPDYPAPSPKNIYYECI